MLVGIALLLAATGTAKADLPLNIDCMNTTLCNAPRKNDNQASGTSNATDFLETYNCNASVVYCKKAVAEMELRMNQTEETILAYEQTKAAKMQFDIDMATLVESEGYTSTDPAELRQLSMTKKVYKFNDPSDGIKRNAIISNMTRIFLEATVCNYTLQNCSHENNPTDPRVHWRLDTLTDIMATSDDGDLLKYVFEQWRIQTGKKMRQKFPTYVQLSNKGAVESGFTDMSQYWRSSMFTDNFTDNDLWYQLGNVFDAAYPLYHELHAYVRHKCANTTWP